MVLWICVGLIAVGILGLLILAYEITSHLRRFQRAMTELQGDTVPRIELLDQFVRSTRTEIAVLRASER